MDPGEFIVVAQQLIKEDAVGHAEANMRTVVNRAYLAALLVTAFYLQSAQAISFPNSYKYYSMVEDELVKQIGEKGSDLLKKLRRWRSEADYEMLSTIDEVTANESIQVATELISIIKKKG
jgi:hypothetical protein